MCKQPLRLLTLLMLLTSMLTVGCRASVEVDDDDSGRNRMTSTEQAHQ